MQFLISKAYQGCQPNCNGHDCVSKKWEANISDHLANWIHQNCDARLDYLTVSHDSLAIIGHKKIYGMVHRYSRDWCDDNWEETCTGVAETTFVTPEPVALFSFGDPFNRSFYGFASQEAEWRKKLAEQILVKG